MMRVVKVRRRRERRERRRWLKIMHAFSRGETTKEMAVKRLGLRDYADLLLVLGHYRVPLPRLPDNEIEPIVRNFLSLWNETDSGDR